MLTRHANALLSRLEHVAHTGACEIRNDELLLWYDQDRVTVSIWRDIQEKWEEILQLLEQKNDVPLLVGEGDGTRMFVWGEGLTVTPKAWIQDVRTLGKSKTESNEEAAKQHAA